MVTTSSLIEFLNKWQTLLGSLIGSLVAIVVALIVADRAPRAHSHLIRAIAVSSDKTVRGRE
ncbi:hypothetical protein AB870_26400 [Pandoraea faecigallinarum]|nr:hypothetical protein AB870_26400 [Pandoraea faecigallinarum]